MIQASNKIFALHTQHTTYAFAALETGQLEHLYYGRRITLKEPLEESAIAPLREKHAFQPGNSCIYDPAHPQYSLEDVCLEVSAHGMGDIREPFVELEYENGSSASDFVYDSYACTEGKEPYQTLPGSYDESGSVEHLLIRMKDRRSGVILELHYYVYESCDVITKSARLVNTGTQTVRIRRLMSSQLDFSDAEYVLTTFHGAWAREMQRCDIRLQAGRYVNESYTGTSSSRANPFFMLAGVQTDEDRGDCYGMNLIYSGNHYAAAEVNAYGKLRVVSGIQPRGFCWELEGGADFEAPEAVLAYSQAGYNGMSQCMHRFVKEHIVRGEWKKKERPVLLNSWEACYFDISEHRLLRLAKEARDAGMELFVMDDGWFGHRDDDTSSLGDWTPNPKKLPHGLEHLCKKINALGLDFGIWVEPEMISTDSELYRAHPDWAMDLPPYAHAEGRNQRMLDLSRADVQDAVIAQMSRLFSSANISYVKWDMNRIASEYYSKALPPERQKETAHRYVLGLYRCLRELTERFPHILFEGCAAGGNRFDLGMLCYFPQIWASDDTDALCRAQIQTGYSYGYPMSVVSAHISACPNHQTLRVTPLETRFQVAAFGVLGYECNLCDMKKEEKQAVREQVALYKRYRRLLQYGSFYRGRCFTQVPQVNSVLTDGAGNLQEWTCVSEDGAQAVGFLMQKLAHPNTQFARYQAKGLLPQQEYLFTNRALTYNVREFGDLVNTVAPVHVRADSLLHEVIAKCIRLDGEQEKLRAYGDTLMYQGVKLKQGFGGTGYNGQVRHFPDFASRMYFMES